MSDDHQTASAAEHRARVIKAKKRDPGRSRRDGRERVSDPPFYRTMPSMIAECEHCGCGWFRDVAGTTLSDRARAQAKAHAKATGHEIRVERTITTRFNPRS